MNEVEQEHKKKVLTAIKPRAKVWLEYEGEPLVGPGRAALLDAIHQEGSLVHAAKKRNVSFRAAWDRLRKIERRLGVQIVQSQKGGEGGGGTTNLTDIGTRIFQRYKQLELIIDDSLRESALMEDYEMKLSARNKLKGTILDIEEGEIIAKVTVKVDQPIIITSVVTMDAVKDLDLKKGGSVEALIKSTHVLLGTE